MRKTLFLIVFVWAAIWVAIFVGAHSAASAREQYAGEFDKVDPAIREWFKTYWNKFLQKSCCGEGDCHILGSNDWGIEDGKYFIRDTVTGDGRKVFVPVFAIVTDRGNPTNNAVACWTYLNGEVNLICFTPGVFT